MAITAANMGFVGWVKFQMGANPGFIRATSCDLRVNQTIDPSEVVDGTIDRTVYKLGPKEIGGSVAFPAVLDQGPGGSGSAMANLWNVALTREGGGGAADNQGGFAVDPGAFTTIVKYSNGTAFNYTGCIVDSYEWSVTQSDVVNVKVNLIGLDRTDNSAVTNSQVAGNSSYPTSNPNPKFSNTRIITWNDVSINAGGVASEFVRSFTCTVANNVKRYYSMNGLLSPSLVTPTKRDITGNVSIIGRSSLISGETGADGNSTRCSANQTIGFSVLRIPRVGTECSPVWAIEFPQMCIFEYEEISLTNELFETKVNYKVFPGEAFTGGNSETFVV